MKIRILFVLLIVGVLFGSANAQRRDYMTEAEIEIVRNNQEVDLRIAALTRMIDRRFALLGITTSGYKPKKSADDWGTDPTGSRTDFFTDIKQLLEKAIDDIDNLAARMPEKTKEEKKGVNVFNKAVRDLAASANRWLPHLKKEYESAKDDKTRGATAAAVEFCEQIIEATAKLK
jgi:ABC-type molybdate transport system substrate-binding protein